MQGVNRGCTANRTSRPKRMPERDRSAQGINFSRIKLQVLDHCEGLRSERFIEFNPVKRLLL